MASKPSSQCSSSARSVEDSKNGPKSPQPKRRSARQNQAARRAAQRINGFELFAQAPKVEYKQQSKGLPKPIGKGNRFVHDNREQNKGKPVSPQPFINDKLQKKSTPDGAYSDQSGGTVAVERHTKNVEPETIQATSVASQTLEQFPNCSNLPKNVCKNLQENKHVNNEKCEYEPKCVKSIMFGDICCALDNRSERPTSSVIGNQCMVNDAATTTADFTETTQSAKTSLRYEHNITNSTKNANVNSFENVPISSAVYENIAMHNPSVENIDSSMNPDDTYARVCSLGQPMTYASALSCGLVKAEHSQTKKENRKQKSQKSDSGEESFLCPENINLVEGEGWNPLFYEPLLVPHPYSVPIPYPTKEQWQEMVIAQREKHNANNGGENNHSSSQESGNGNQNTLYQQIQNWLAQGQANYLQKQKAFQAAKLKAAKDAEGDKQKQTKIMEQQQHQQHPMQQQHQQHPMQQQTTNTQQRLRKEQVPFTKAKSLKKTGFRQLCAPYTLPTEERSTWSSIPASAEIQKELSREISKSISQVTSNSIKNGEIRRNFGSFNGPMPTMTPSAFPNPYLWSVDTSNPFWLTDQRPTFANANEDAAYGRNLLPPKPKKKESTELVDAIKAGVGLLGSFPSETYYENLYASRPKTFNFNDINGGAHEHVSEPINVAGIMTKEAGVSSISNMNMSTKTSQQCATPIWNQELTYTNENSIENRIANNANCSSANNKSVSFMPNHVVTFKNTDLELQPEAEMNEEDHRFGWKTVPPRSKKNWSWGGLMKKNNSSAATSKAVLKSHSSRDNECATTSKKFVNIEPKMNKFGSTTDGTHGNKRHSNETESDEFLSGAADDDVDFGEDSFKSCLQCHCDCSEVVNDSCSVSSLEEDKPGIVSGASSPSISTRFVTPSELELTYTNHKVTLTNHEEEEISSKSTLEHRSKTLKLLNETTNEGIQFQIDGDRETHSEVAQTFTFDMEATRSKLQNFNLYIEPKDPSAMEAQGVECTVEAMNVLLNKRVNNRPCVRGILSIHQNVKPDELRQKNLNYGGGGIERQFYQCNSTNSEIQLKSQGPMQNSTIDDFDDAKRSVSRYNSHWKSVEMTIAGQQQNQPQYQQQPQHSQQQGFNLSQSSIFTNSFHNNHANHAKRDCRKPRQTKSATIHSPTQMQQQSKLAFESLKLAEQSDQFPPGEPNTRPMHLESIMSSKEKHVELIQEKPMDSTEYNVQMKPSKP